MAKVIALIASALCVLALASLAQSAKSAKYNLFVEGNVVCDQCLVGNKPGTVFGTRIPRAKVELKCKNLKNGTVTYTRRAKTDHAGVFVIRYSIPHSKNLEEDLCHVSVVSSPDPNCNQFSPDLNTNRVEFTPRDDGIKGFWASHCSLGFQRKEPLPSCNEKQI